MSLNEVSGFNLDESDAKVALALQMNSFSLSHSLQYSITSTKSATMFSNALCLSESTYVIHVLSKTDTYLHSYLTAFEYNLSPTFDITT